MYNFKYGEVTIPYNIIKSGRIKTSQIAIDKNGVIVRIPNTKSIEQTKLMVLQKAQWIFKKTLQYKNQIPQIPQITFKKYSTIPYKGKNYSFEVMLGGECGSKTRKKYHTIPHYAKKTHHFTTKANVSEMVAPQSRSISWYDNCQTPLHCRKATTYHHKEFEGSLG